MGKSIWMRRVTGLAMGIAISFQIGQIGLAQKGGTPGPGLSPLGSLINKTPGLPGSNGAAGSVNGNIYLIGNVMLDDGNPPPDPVTIERVCGGSPRAQAYTDKKGRFSFQIGQTAGIMQDASEDSGGTAGMNRSVSTISGWGGPPQQQSSGAATQLANCDLRAVLPGFRSDSVPLGVRRLMDDPNIGTIVLHRLANVAGSAISVTSLQAPKDAHKAYEKGLEALRKDKYPEAEKSLQKAVDLYPAYAAAWYELGRVQQQNENLEAARKSYTQAVAADGKFVSPYLGLAEMEVKAQNWKELADVTGKLLKLDAVDYPVAYLYDATADLNLGRIDEAEKSARAGEKLDSSHQIPRLEKVLAMILTQKREFAAAAEHLHSYLLLAPVGEDVGRTKKELAELERLAGLNEQARVGTAGK